MWERVEQCFGELLKKFVSSSSSPIFGIKIALFCCALFSVLLLLEFKEVRSPMNGDLWRERGGAIEEAEEGGGV
jgi:hypothetical protein